MRIAHFNVNPHHAHSAFELSSYALHHPPMQMKRIRLSKGLSQADLGEMIGVNQATIARAESMDKTAKLITYIKCADALNVSLSDIFADDRDQAERLLLEAFHRLPAERQAAWIEMARMVQLEAQSERAEDD